MEERKIIPNGNPVILSEGRLGAIVGFPVFVNSGNGYEEKVFERFVRPPGTRIIALNENRIFLQKEHRLEAEKGFDWRLPGGKVMDSFSEYKKFIGKDVPENIILEAGRKELREEAKLDTSNLKILKKSICGASVEWDLYYIIAENTVDFDHNHNEGEEIVDGGWFSFDEVLNMCKNGEINEDRTVSALYQYISTNSNQNK